MNNFYSYAFLIGMYIGGYTNLFSKIVISGLVLYIGHPEYFEIKRFSPLYEQVYDITIPYITKVYTVQDTKITTLKLPPLKTESLIKKDK